jgi:hypothetical protein
MELPDVPLTWGMFGESHVGGARRGVGPHR